MAATDSDTQPSGTTPGGIVEFLLARVAEDEAVAWRASAVTAAEWVANGSVLMHIADPVMRLAEATATVEHYGMDDAWRHAERHDPARVLAECQAKRAILAEWTSLEVGDEDMRNLDHSHEYRTGMVAALLGTLRRLAAVYADHPDYQPAWRP